MMVLGLAIIVAIFTGHRLVPLLIAHLLPGSCGFSMGSPPVAAR
jgi:hypothetical protein